MRDLSFLFWRARQACIYIIARKKNKINRSKQKNKNSLGQNNQSMSKKGRPVFGAA